MELSVKDIAELLSGELLGDSGVTVSNIAQIDEAKEGDIACVFDKKTIEKLSSANPSAVVTLKDLGLDIPTIVVKNQMEALSLLLNKFRPAPILPASISDKAFISDDVSVGQNVSIAPFVSIADGVIIGDNVTIYSGVHIGEGVSIGEDSVIYANVSINHGVSIGNRVTIHSNASIGSDGFGFYPNEKGVYQAIPQVGSVVLEDDVNIGANSCIDRGTIGDTTIRRGTKIDNLVQVAHNCDIGPNVVIAGQTGISGSVTIGANSRLGGNVGIADHITIPPNTDLAARATVLGQVKENGVYAGFPAIKYEKWARIQATLKKLPELVAKIRVQGKKIDELEKKMEDK